VPPVTRLMSAPEGRSDLATGVVRTRDHLGAVKLRPACIAVFLQGNRRVFPTANAKPMAWTRCTLPASARPRRLLTKLV
jgi:hypothetical protein